VLLVRMITREVWILAAGAIALEALFALGAIVLLAP